jgi:hypothetical protein
MMFDLRSNERWEFPDYKIEYTFDHFSTDEIFAADLINASQFGLCMLSAHRLTVGQEITLRNFMTSSSRTAVVIWIAEDDEGGGFDKSDQALFKIGLQFSEQNS